ncbi:MAG: class I SAM-dependent methyltransferase [Actinomycetota bacterium]
MSTVALARPCPACGRDRGTPDVRAGIYALVACPCGLRMLDAPLDGGHVLENNSEKYGDEDYNRWYRSMRDVLMQRYRNDLSEIEKLVPNKGRILDVGCAYGWFLEAARERGWQTSGVEVEEATAHVARDAGLDVTLGLLDDANFPDASFDVVGLWDVLEHVPGTDAFLAECRRVLRPGGILAVQSPNVRSVMARLMKDDWSWLLLPQHVYHFTPSSMRKTLERRGFDVARAYTWEPTEAFVQDATRKFKQLGRVRIRKAATPLIKVMERLWCAAGRGGLLRVYARRLP